MLLQQTPKMLGYQNPHTTWPLSFVAQHYSSFPRGVSYVIAAAAQNAELAEPMHNIATCSCQQVHAMLVHSITYLCQAV